MCKQIPSTGADNRQKPTENTRGRYESNASRGSLSLEHDRERVLTGQAKMLNDKFNNQEFRKAIEKYYGTKAIVDGIARVYCSLVDWCGFNDVRFEEPAHLYGVDLECPKNGI